MGIQKRMQCGRCGVTYKIKNLNAMYGIRFCKKCSDVLVKAAYAAASKEYDAQNGLVANQSGDSSIPVKTS